jgi:NADPH-dependent F420 reductase
MARIAILGGTGPEGMGLGVRFALAGESVLIGSRQQQRAEEAAAKLQDRLRQVGCARAVEGGENAEVASRAEVVALTFPYEGAEAILTALQPALRGKIVLDTVNPMVLKNGLFYLQPVPAGSAGEQIQQWLPDSQVVAGFKNLSARELWDVRQPLHGDVLLCGDFPEATRFFVDLIRRMPELRAVDAGALANAHHLESITTLLMNLNRRYKALTSVQILGLKF